jgi:cyclin D2
MELLCIEVENEPKGYLDPVFLDDERVLGNLLQTEEKYIISSHYFNCFQSELQPYMRKIVCSWMLEVSYATLIARNSFSIMQLICFVCISWESQTDIWHAFLLFFIPLFIQVCEEEKCQDEVFTLAMNIMDRYLSQVVIRKKELQLLGTVSLFLASKLRQTVSLDADRLVSYTDNSITSEDLLVSWLMPLSI